MRRALAQNPNLLRTLIGLGLTLVIILSYAVYGATINTEYHVYQTESNSSTAHLTLINNSTSVDADGEEWTEWIWHANINTTNLTWVNISMTEMPDGSILKVINIAGWYSHPELGLKDAEQFNCASQCLKSSSHSSISENGDAGLTGLTATDPARRDGGTVRAENSAEARQMAEDAISHEFEESHWEIRAIVSGNHSEEPVVIAQHVNEEFSSIEQFALDTATEMMWALAAVIGCFILVLVPIMMIYIFSRLGDKQDVEVVDDGNEQE
ncbi:MAG: hypothetical protein QGF72_02950 [Candidatus Poseidoniaceae archaeon]|jgi:hypothetical protein|nr:hypothetical protein [Candidatus Poseidoniaceae archaeon]